jgi:CRISPR-associated protein Cas2
MVIVVKNVTPRLRGRLAVWYLEIRAGVYVGKSRKRHRERVWDTVTKELRDSGQGNAVMAWSRRNEMGFDFKTAGEDRRMPVDFDGLKLVEFLPQEDDEEDD